MKKKQFLIMKPFY